MEASAQLSAKLDSALAGRTIGAEIAVANVPLMDAAYFADNHNTTVSELGGRSKAGGPPVAGAFVPAVSAVPSMASMVESAVTEDNGGLSSGVVKASKGFRGLLGMKKKAKR